MRKLRDETKESPIGDVAGALATITAVRRSATLPAYGLALVGTPAARSAEGPFLFIASRAGDDAQEEADRALFKVTTGGAPSMIHRGPVRTFALAPEGERVALAIADDATDPVLLLDSQGRELARNDSGGLVEWLEWHPRGERVLALTAGAGTDGNTAAGAVRRGGGGAPDAGADVVIDDGSTPDAWRRVAALDLPAWGWSTAARCDAMIWEASWCGVAHCAVIYSDRRDEAGWYDARIGLLDLMSGTIAQLHVPQHQLGWIRGAPDGSSIAFIEALGSDRGIICGTLCTVDPETRRIAVVDTGDVDITSVEWRDARSLQCAGLCRTATILGEVDCISGTFLVQAVLEAESAGAFQPSATPVGPHATLVVMESWDEPPWMTVYAGGAFRRILTDDGRPPFEQTPKVLSETVTWCASDGLEIDGILIRRHDAPRPTALVVDVHGGPVWMMRPCWQGRLRATAALVADGYAVLYPNPRGSTGRGQAFARQVLADMGGADAQDILAGIDYLAAAGDIDSGRVGVTGSSYGGYMGAWLPKLRSSITAAVAISPVSNWFSQHWTSNLPMFEHIFIGGAPSEVLQRYASRSPVLVSAPTLAPTLILAGALDRSTVVGQAQELHNALLAGGTTSVLVTYASAGHSLREPDAYLDSAARILAWFRRYMPA